MKKNKKILALATHYAENPSKRPKIIGKLIGDLNNEWEKLLNLSFTPKKSNYKRDFELHYNKLLAKASDYRDFCESALHQIGIDEIPLRDYNPLAKARNFAEGLFYGGKLRLFKELSLMGIQMKA